MSARGGAGHVIELYSEPLGVHEGFLDEMMLTLVGQRMAIRLMRLDGDDSRGQYIEVYLSV